MQNLGRTGNLVAIFERVKAVMLVLTRQKFQAGALPNSQPPMPNQRSLSVMLVYGVFATETLASNDVLGKLGR